MKWKKNYTTPVQSLWRLAGILIFLLILVVVVLVVRWEDVVIRGRRLLRKGGGGGGRLCGAASRAHRIGMTAAEAAATRGRRWQRVEAAKSQCQFVGYTKLKSQCHEMQLFGCTKVQRQCQEFQLVAIFLNTFTSINYQKGNKVQRGFRDSTRNSS